jgi:vesicle coat complex subunit
MIRPVCFFSFSNLMKAPEIVNRMTRLFEMIAQVLSSQTPLIQQFYGEQHVATAVLALEQEAILQGNKFLDLYQDKRQLNRKMRDMQMAPQDLDLRDLAGILDELCALSHHVHLFNRFISQRSPTVNYFLKHR